MTVGSTTESVTEPVEPGPLPRRPARRFRSGTWRILGMRLPRIAFLAALGPGLVSGFADNDAGGITTYSVGTVGTTITPWGQAFIQSYTADKNLRAADLAASRVDITSGALLTNLLAGFIVVACAATLFAHGRPDIPDAATAAQAVGPFAARAATVLFALGLLAASLLGLGTVPRPAPTQRRRRSAGSAARLALARGPRSSTACSPASSGSPPSWWCPDCL